MTTDAGADGWDAVRQTVLERDDYACRFCGIDDEQHREEYGRGLHAHHVIPEGDGGEDRPENLITVCGSCHRTLEDTHGRAVADMKRREDYADDLEGVTRVWRERQETLDDLDDALAEFVDGHPTFADEFGETDRDIQDIPEADTVIEAATADSPAARYPVGRRSRVVLSGARLPASVRDWSTRTLNRATITARRYWEFVWGGRE